MANRLEVSIGQHSAKGRKDINQDFHGALVPEPPALVMKGIAIALADGISSSAVSHIAAETAVKSFLTDYYCTSDAWPVKTAAQRVIAATNAWLHAQTKRGPGLYDLDKGYICTLSAMVLKSRTAHLFHIGDSRIFRIAGNGLEQLTEDHKLILSPQESYLARALGTKPHVEIEYRAVPVEPGDVFILATDGVYEHVNARFMTRTIEERAGDLNLAAQGIAEEAYKRGSEDNLTVQIVRVDGLPYGEADDFLSRPADLQPPPLLEARMEFDGYRIVREIHATSRSHIYLAEDMADGAAVAIKVPSIDLRGDPAYLKRFMMEEWIARRLNSAHVIKPHPQTRKRNYLYAVTEYVEGQTFAQWMIDNPAPSLETIREIVAQIAKGLRAFHRKEMVHQDLTPGNIMIDRNGTAKIIDFGSTKVAGVIEAGPAPVADEILGTVQYTAPEYFAGGTGTPCSDLFSLGVIAYQLLTGKLPYGAEVAKTRTQSQQRRLRYTSARYYNPSVPDWIDGALKKAVHPDPGKRYQALSEFEYDLRHPNSDFMPRNHIPLLERDPLLFWKVLSLILACIVFFLLARLR
jgi:serine/threonine protein phosphatase PrpC